MSAPDGFRIGETESHSPDVALVGQADGVELQGDRIAEAAGGLHGRVGIGSGDRGRDDDPGRAEQVQRLALGQRVHRRLSREVGAATSWPYFVRSAASAGQPGRHGPSASRCARRPSHHATRAIAVNASIVPRRSGIPPAASSAAWISGVASPEVSDTNTGRTSGRSAVALASSAASSVASSTSPACERNGKSWTTATTS